MRASKSLFAAASSLSSFLPPSLARSPFSISLALAVAAAKSYPVQVEDDGRRRLLGCSVAIVEWAEDGRDADGGGQRAARAVVWAGTASNWLARRKGGKER